MPLSNKAQSSGCPNFSCDASDTEGWPISQSGSKGHLPGAAVALSAPRSNDKTGLTQSVIVFCALRKEQPGLVQGAQGSLRCHCATPLHRSLGSRCLSPNSMQSQVCFGVVATCAVQTPTILLLDKLSASATSSTTFDFTRIAGMCVLSSMPGTGLPTRPSGYHLCTINDILHLFSQMPVRHAPGKLSSRMSLTQLAGSCRHDHSCRAQRMPPDRCVKITYPLSQWTESAGCIPCSC